MDPPHGHLTASLSYSPVCQVLDSRGIFHFYWRLERARSGSSPSIVPVHTLITSLVHSCSSSSGTYTLGRTSPSPCTFDIAPMASTPITEQVLSAQDFIGVEVSHSPNIFGPCSPCPRLFPLDARCCRCALDDIRLGCILYPRSKY